VIAVPFNTVFGVGCALLLVRTNFRGKALINAIIDLPFAISPVVIGLSLLLVYSETGWFGDWLNANGIQVIFALPGIVLATIFVTLPFVVREVVPVLHEIGDEQEQAAQTLGANWWQTFWRITLPAIRWGVGYGVVIGTARALGEFGAVAVVSGRIAGQTQTATIWISEAFSRYDYTGAYFGAVVLAVLAVGALLAMNVFKRKEAA
jgi:sulfate transport system permease protein